MLNFLFYNPLEKKLSEYIKLSNDISIKKLKDRYSIKPPYKIKYDFTSLSDYENIMKKNNFYENEVNNTNNSLIFVSIIETIVIFSISFVIYKNI